MNRKRLVTAYHEAGHGCAYVHYNIAFKCVRLHSDTSGAVSTLPHRASWTQRAVLVLAGPVAEARVTGQPITQLLASDSCATDWCMAREALSHLRVSVAIALARTATVVAMEWPKIELLADELAARDHLDYAEVYTILYPEMLAHDKSQRRWPRYGQPGFIEL